MTREATARRFCNRAAQVALIAGCLTSPNHVGAAPATLLEGAPKALPKQDPDPAESARPAFTTLVVEYEIGGTMPGMEGAARKKTLHIDRARSRWAEHQQTPLGERMSFSDGTWRYDLDPRARTGTKRWLTRFDSSIHTGLLTEQFLAGGGAVKVGSEEIAGLTCERWEHKDPVSVTTTWLWNGVVMGTEITMGEMKTRERAVRIEIDVPIPEERFRVPDGIVLTEDTFPGLALLRAMDADPEPGVATPALERPEPEIGREPFAFPSVEPFRSSPMWDIAFGAEGSPLDVDRCVSYVGVQLGTLTESRNAVAKYFGKATPEGPSALLQPAVSDEDRVWWMVLPRIVSELAPLYETLEWSEDQLATARKAARFLSLGPSGPRLDFSSDEPERRRAQLESLGRWFLAQTEHPERYAAMLLTMDFGPYAGLPLEAGQPVRVRETIPLDATKSLRLCRVGGPEPFALQCVEGERVLWSRLISDAPERTVRRVAFLDTPPEKLGSFGWRVHLEVRWEYGDEYTHLYLDPDGDFLFYFMSW